MFNFVIKQVFPGTEKQKASGIYATFNLDIDCAEGTVVSLRDLKLNKAKDGKFYIGSPYRAYQAKGETEEKKVHFIKIWPEQKNWPKQDDLIKAVQDKLAMPQPPKAETKPVASQPQAEKVVVTKKPTTVLEDW